MAVAISGLCSILHHDMSEAYTLQSGAQSPYEVHTPAFEGPLQLLLKLIEKNELDITRVALAEVTDEFMEHVDGMRSAMEIEIVADFLFIAAKLLWIKSRALLPKPPAAAIQANEDDVGDELIRQLRAYRQYKEAVGWLRERDHSGLRAYVRGSHKPQPQRVSLDLGDLTVERLHDIALAALFPIETPRPEGAIQRPRLSISQQIALVRQRLNRWVKVSFRKLLGATPTRLEAVITLQAVLELMKQRAVTVRQTEMFGDIIIEEAQRSHQVEAAGTPEESPAAEPVH
jgi:segregation and condensation protein A